MSTTPIPTQALLRPNALRLLPQLPLWALAFGVFYKTLEMATPLPITQTFSFWLYFCGNMTGSVTTFVLGGMMWFVVARHYWLHDEAARIRYEQEGMYALLPLHVMLPLVLVIYFTCALASNGLWRLGVQALGMWTPAICDVSTLKSSMVFHGFSMIVVFSVDFFQVKAQMQRLRAEKAHRLNVEAQLQRLQAQMEPHMLFNTLANLHALIETEPQRAQDMLAHLIDYLRATLSASRAGTLPLGEEMARVRDYLELMQIRMGQRLRVSLDVPAELQHMDVPPMLVQPLIENAIKHGLDPMPDGGALHVTARREGQTLEISVRDNGCGLPAQAPHTPGAPSTAPQGGGFGLDCIRARLRTAFGEHASLTLNTDPMQAGTIATLRMPCQTSAS